MTRKRQWTANRIKRLRMRLKWNPTKFAAAIGVSQVTVWRWEKGLFVPVMYKHILALERLEARK